MMCLTVWRARMRLLCSCRVVVRWWWGIRVLLVRGRVRVATLELLLLRLLLLLLLLPRRRLLGPLAWVPPAPLVVVDLLRRGHSHRVLAYAIVMGLLLVPPLAYGDEVYDDAAWNQQNAADYQEDGAPCGILRLGGSKV